MFLFFTERDACQLLSDFLSRHRVTSFVPRWAFKNAPFKQQTSAADLSFPLSSCAVQQATSHRSKCCSFPQVIRPLGSINISFRVVAELNTLVDVAGFFFVHFIILFLINARRCCIRPDVSTSREKKQPFERLVPALSLCCHLMG